MTKHQTEIMGITETKGKGNRLPRLHKGEVGLIITTDRIKHIINERYINERILTVGISLIERVANWENEDARK